MTLPTFIAVDVETTLNGNEDIGSAHPMCPENRVVAFGMTDSTGRPVAFYEDAAAFEFSLKSYPKVGAIFCGHNFAFDMLYMFRTKPSLKELIQKSRVWDTQIAEYIITGQRSKFSSLDDLALKYGFPLKDDKVKAYFENGLGSEKVPFELLVTYLKQDVEVTWKIANKQWEIAKAQDQLTLIQTQMEALQATTEMMYNGLHIDKATLDSYTIEVVNSFVDCKLGLEAKTVGYIEDVNSPMQWSKFFFGGKKKIRVNEEVGVYKNGKPKFKLADKVVTVEPFIDYKPDPEKVSAKTGQISVDDSVLTDMLDHTFNVKAREIINNLLEYRTVSKQLSTYVQGLSKHVINDYIHGKLNHTQTVTGRLSSTSPNLQNISNNPIKKIFNSRWGTSGLIVEVDFNQLEVVALAHVTDDKQLIKDISGGADIHSELYKDMYGRYPTKEERKPFKGRTFQLIYGAGAKAIAKQAKCSLEEATKFVNVFYGRYPNVAKWHKEFAALVDAYGRHFKDKEGSLEKFRTFVHTTPTGRRFVFTEYYNENAWSLSNYTFSPTELKNYPIQGLATGDIVPMMLGVIFRKLIGREDVKLLNTIHDSVLFDVKVEAIGDFILDIKEIFQNTHKYFEETFKHPLALKLNAGVSVGANWFEMEEIK